MEIEIFNDYFVSDNGDVISYKEGGRRILKPSTNPNGYRIVNLRIDGKTKGFSVHSLVAKAFVEKLNDKTQVNHINGDKSDNRSINLEWVTPSENVKHSFNKLNRKASNVRKIKIIEMDIEFNSIIDCANFLINKIGIESSETYVENSIWRVLNGRRKSYKKLTFSYVES